jgi:hypothetical protein
MRQPVRDGSDCRSTITAVRPGLAADNLTDGGPHSIKQNARRVSLGAQRYCITANPTRVHARIVSSREPITKVRERV